jgi:hypothetical protein
MLYLIWLLLHYEVVVGCAHTLAQSVDVVIDDGRDARCWGAINRSRDQPLGSKLKKKKDATVGSGFSTEFDSDRRYGYGYSRCMLW